MDGGWFKDIASAAQSAASNVREFDKTVRGSISTRELLEQIEQQQDELVTYKKRTRDLVTSYRAVVDEKNKLQKTLQTLSQAPPQQSAQKTKRVKLRKRRPECVPLPTSDGESNDDSEYDTWSDSSNSSQQATVDTGQIQALTKQLSEAIQQKNKQEETFKTDRRIMKADYEKRIAQLSNDLTGTKEELELQNEQLDNIKETLRASASESQKEKDGADKQRREAQHQIFKYRQNIENLEIKLDREKDARKNAEMSQERSSAEFTANHEILQKYRSEVDSLKAQLLEANQKLAKPDTTNLSKIRALEAELDFKTKEWSKQTEIWQQQRTEAAQRTKSVEKTEESRRAGLEAQINELSLNIGVIEKQKLKDQEIISQLNDRVNQLELENLNLLSKSKTSADLTTDELPKFMYEVATKNYADGNIFSCLLIASRKAVSEDVSIGAVMQVFPEVKTHYEKQILVQKEEIQNLTREISKNRRHSENNSMKHSPSSPNGQNSKNEEKLKQQNAQLQSQLADLKSHIVSIELKQKNHQSMLHSEYEKKVKSSDQAWRNRLQELEIELINQRERSLKTLNDKERELQQLRAAMHSPPPTPEFDGGEGGQRKSSMSRASLASIDENPSQLGNELDDKLQGQSGQHAMHYSEKLARKDIELDTLKKQNKECVRRIRQLQEKIVADEEVHSSVVVEYKDRLAVAINPSSQHKRQGEVAHNDYIKNVLFNFLVMPTRATGRQQTLQALAASLNFTSEELNKVRQVQKL